MSFIVLSNQSYNATIEEIFKALALGQSVSYRFKKDERELRVFARFKRNRFPYRRAQKDVRTSIISYSRLSSGSERSAVPPENWTLE